MYIGSFYVVIDCISYCAKHNQHAQHANARGLWACSHQENFEHTYSEIESEGISESKCCIMCINFKSHNNCEMKSQESSPAMYKHH